MVIVVEKNTDGNVSVPMEEFKKMIEDARADGYNDGYSKGYCDGKSAITVFPYISPTVTYKYNDPYRYEITCCNSETGTSQCKG